MARVVQFPTNRPARQLSDVSQATLFTMLDPGGRRLTCATFDNGRGIELRLTYSDNEVMRSQHFREIEHEDDVANMAAAWRRLLVEKGFVDLTTP